MKPSIRYELKDSIVNVKISTAGKGQGFSLGITIDPGSWDQQKQICGDPAKQKFLIDAKKKIEDLFLPGMTAVDIWNAYVSILDKGKSHTISSAFDYIVKNKTMSSETRRGYVDMHKKAVTYNFADVLLTALTPAMIKSYLDLIREHESLSEGSIYTYYTKMESAINYYMADHGLEARGKIKGLLRAPHINRGKIQYSEQEFLDTEELKTFMQINVEEGTFIAEAKKLFIRQAFSGMSAEDLCKMKSLDGYLPTIDDEIWFEYTRAKTGRKCQIPLTDALHETLTGFKPMPFTKRTYNNYLGILGKVIGKHLSSHVGRHTFGVIMLEAGFSIETVSKMMGHSSIGITEQCYAKITKNRVRKERNVALPALNNLVCQ